MSRLTAAVIVSVPAALLLVHQEQAKLDAWAQNPAAAQAVQLHYAGEMASFGMAFVTMAVWLLVIALLIEGVSSLVRGNWRRST